MIGLNGEDRDASRRCRATLALFALKRFRFMILETIAENQKPWNI